MPTQAQYQTVKQQCNAFEALGSFVSLDVVSDKLYFGEPRVLIALPSNKTYRFCEPNWNVVISQLATLYRSLKNEKNICNGGKREEKA